MAGLSYDDLVRLHNGGQLEACVVAVRRLFESAEPIDQSTAAFFALTHVLYAEFGPALEVLKPAFAAVRGDYVMCSRLAFAAWVERDFAFCEEACRRCIELDPGRFEGYLYLGLQYTQQGRFGEACAIFAEGGCRSPKDAPNLHLWMAVSDHRLKGNDPVPVHFEGIDLLFEIATFNGQAISASATYLSGKICEAEELRVGRTFARGSRAYVEVGASVGNHAAFFAKALSLESLRIFDGDPEAVRQITRTLELNGCGLSARIAVRRILVGARAEKRIFHGTEEDVISLDEAVPDRVDFLKIDVDGMEMEVLEGCRGLFQSWRPKVMIEVDAQFDNRFRSFVREQNYRVVHRIGHGGYANYFIESNAGGPEAK
jgi:hypothetical protein